MPEQQLADQNSQPELPDVPVGWISEASDEELRRQELTWGFSETNKNSPQGKILIPLLQAEMKKRGIAGYNLNPDDPQHFEQILSAIKGTLE